MTEKVEVHFHEDGDHVWINGMQFISLNRFIRMKNCQLNEMQLLQDKVTELTKENEHLKQTIKVLAKN